MFSFGITNEDWWNMQWREWRHNPCLMRPLSALLLLGFVLFWIVVAVLKLPTIVLGILLGPLLQRFQWVVEFWYPLGIGRWLHLTIVHLAERSRNKTDATNHLDVNHGFHSRSIETRIEVVPERVFIHPLPQLLDNVGYLVVCLPPITTKQSAISPQHTNIATTTTTTILSDDHIVKVTPVTMNGEGERKIVAFVVDCGDADAVAKQIKLIRHTYYGTNDIHVQAVLSTHKHHDHTAGNKDILKHPDFEANPVKFIFGGAVDNVPYCNYPLRNGDKLPLPKVNDNCMSDVIEVEAVATPAHTRGSLTYVLRARSTFSNESTSMVCLFTGDTVFSGGAGVAFEADIDPGQDKTCNKMTANSYIKASAAGNAVERCFAEVLYRSTPPNNKGPSREALLVFPGHEYTSELLARQLTNSQENCKFRNFAPAFFFETMSQAFISVHRRTLPSSSGHLLNIPSSIQRELYINPQLRSLKQRGIVLIAAIRLWNRNFAKHKVTDVIGPAFPKSLTEEVMAKKKRATNTQWNLDLNDINRKIFTTVYADDLDAIICELNSGRLDTQTAARRLEEIKDALEKPIVGRRPIPGTLPSTKIVYRGLLAFALLGSSPTAATLSDSTAMKMPKPIGTSSDRIRVSKKRLTAVLYWLGLCDDNDGEMVVRIIHRLWKETLEYTAQVQEADGRLRNDMIVTANGGGIKSDSSTDVESMPIDRDDEVELGALKWVIYGIPERPKPSWFTYCMPCSKPKQDVDRPSKDHLAGKLGMNRHGGELVRHDVLTCPLCRNATGCPFVLEITEDIDIGVEDNSLHRILSSTHIAADENHDGDDMDEGNVSNGSSFVEVSPMGIAAALQEF